jgi:methyl-accepting chemotaxis protein
MRPRADGTVKGRFEAGGSFPLLADSAQPANKSRHRHASLIDTGENCAVGTYHGHARENEAVPNFASRSLGIPLFSVVGILAILLTGSLAWKTHQSAAERALSVRTETGNTTSDLLLAAAGRLAVERGRSAGLLNAPEPASSADRAFIEAQRHAADTGLDGAMSRLAAQYGDSAPYQALAAARANIAAPRRRFDAALGLPKAQREPGLAGAAIAELTALIEISQRLRVATELEATALETRVAEYQRFKHFVWTVSEYAGRERATINSIIATNESFSPQQVQLLAGLRGRVELAWETIDAVLARPDTPPALAEAGRSAHVAFFDTFQPVRLAVYQAGITGQAYPMSAPAWFEQATRAIEAVLRLSETAGAETVRFAQVSRANSDMLLLMTGLGLLAAVLVTGASIWIVLRQVTQPIARITRVMGALANGNLELDVPALGRRDEIGAMAAAVQEFRTQAIEHRRLAAEQADERLRAEQDKRAALHRMAETIELESSTALEQVRHSTDAMTVTAEEMNASATRTGGAAKSASEAARQALVNAQAVASAAEQLAASIHEISGQVAQSTIVVGRAVAAGHETRITIEALNGKVAQIAAVADTIAAIAARTNLLALNATIEAARAGEAGKGFAVVAGEVKQLANQTAQSTEDIARHVREVRAATDASVDSVGRIEATITEVNAIASSIAAAVEEQGAATGEIARNVAQTAEAADDMTGRITEVSGEAERTGHLAGRVHDDAAGLATAVGELTRTVVRVVRTSTDEVDRRAFERHVVDLPCRVTLAGGMVQAGRIVNLSEGGAAVAGLPALALGSRGAVRLDALGTPLAFVVRRNEGEALGLAFELDEGAATQLRSMLQRLGMSAAA